MVRLSLFRSTISNVCRSPQIRKLKISPEQDAAAAAARTVALYQQDESLRTHTTKVVAIQSLSELSEANRALFKQVVTQEDEEKNDLMVVTTAETIFFAQGGGQPSDSGTMRSTTTVNGGSPDVFEVTSVRKTADGKILHLGRYTTNTTNNSSSPSSSSSSSITNAPFHPGDTVLQTIDGEKRDLNSRLHTGGHVLGLAVRHVVESLSIPNFAELKASHYPGAASCEFQGLIDGKHKAAIQAKVDELVQRALPVKVEWFTEEQLKERSIETPDTITIPEGELIRAVVIVGAGVYPCGGTYVTDTSLVRNVVVKKISRSKGTTKVSYSVS